ncbi:unnamed protein product [Camellia sinensis]
MVRNQMKSVKNIQKITKAMKMVAAYKLRAIQVRTENSRGLWQPFTALLDDTPKVMFNAILENACSEQGARMSAMDNSSRNAGEMLDRLTLTYNRLFLGHLRWRAKDEDEPEGEDRGVGDQRNRSEEDREGGADRDENRVVDAEVLGVLLKAEAFANGRALGGHMRSHLANLPIPPKTQKPQQLSEPTESASSLSSSSEEEQLREGSEEKALVYGLRENPKRSFRLVDPKFLDGGSVVQDRESETESSRNPTRR